MVNTDQFTPLIYLHQPFHLLDRVHTETLGTSSDVAYRIDPVHLIPLYT